MNTKQRREQLEQLSDEALMIAAYAIVVKLGATTPDGIELRAILTTMFKRWSGVVRVGQGGQG
jgi:hypothetical protein